MSDATAILAGPRRLPRDPRVDVLRRLALVMIFIDHVPGNLLGLVTLRNFGFADAAELFVPLAGFASMVAYGDSFAREGPTVGLRRVLVRCLRLYLFQAIMLLTVLVMASVAAMLERARHRDTAPRGAVPALPATKNVARTPTV